MCGYNAFLLRNPKTTTVKWMAPSPCKSDECLAFRACTTPKATSHFALARFQRRQASRISLLHNSKSDERLAFRSCTMAKAKQAASDHARYSQEMSRQPPYLKRQGAKGPRDQRTRGPKDQRTKGPEDQGTIGPRGGPGFFRLLDRKAL